MAVVNLALRGTQWLFWVILLALSAYLVWAESTFVNSYEDDWGYYYYSSGIYVPQYAYMLFAAIWTFLVLIPLTLYTIGKAPSVLGHPIFAFVLEVLTTVFWFSAFIAVAAFTAASYFYGDRGVTVFGVSVAASVFGALEWGLFVATTVLAGLAAFRGGRSGRGGVNMPRSTAPAPAPAPAAAPATEESKSAQQASYA